MTEGSMLLSGVDVDVRFGDADPARGEPGAIDRTGGAVRPRRRRSSTRPWRRARPCGAKPPASCGATCPPSTDLTTVNPDHVLASLLRSSPYRRVDRDDLARRLFLVAGDLRARAFTPAPGVGGEPAAPAYGRPQGHPAGFPRAWRWKRAICGRRARSTGRNGPSFATTSSFHRARIDNPLDGMANAVEPLFEVRRRVGRMALYPAAVVRWLVRRRLVREAVEEFAADYRHLSHPRGVEIPGVGMPFLVRGRRPRIGGRSGARVHGGTAGGEGPGRLPGVPRLLGVRAAAARARHFPRGPRDTHAARTGRRRLDRGYAIMKTLCRRVVAGGFSTGGGLALDLASRVDDLAGVFSISAPLRLRDFNARFAPAVNAWNRLMDAAGRTGAKMPFVENHPENPHINYAAQPGVRRARDRAAHERARRRACRRSAPPRSWFNPSGTRWSTLAAPSAFSSAWDRPTRPTSSSISTAMAFCWEKIRRRFTAPSPNF